MLAFSTNWNSARHEKGGAMLREIEELGFQWVELGHGIRSEAVVGIIKYLSKTNLKVCSVHNYCPLPPGLRVGAPNFIELTSLQATDRKRAVQKTKETIDFANQVGAMTVILHLGSFVSIRRRETSLIKYLEQSDRRRVASKLKLVKLWERGINELWERINEGLMILISYAKTKKIKLGIENRAFFSELPSENWECLGQHYSDDTLGYWHDFGHAQIKEYLGWANHWETFTKKKEKLLGCHFHDAIFSTQDHQALGTGRVPWDLLLPQVPREIPWVMEYHPRLSPEIIQKDRERLNSLAER